MSHDPIKHGTNPEEMLADARKSLTAPKSNEVIENIPCGDIIPNRFQPRKYFDPAKMAALEESIKDKGVLQPILVRRIEDPSSPARFELIAGERRWRASQKLGNSTIPGVIRDMPDSESEELASIENMQREDLCIWDEITNAVALLASRPASRVANIMGKSTRQIEKYRSAHNAIAELPEFMALFEQDRTVTLKCATDFALVADKFRRLKTSNKREFERLMKRLAKAAEKADKNTVGMNGQSDYLLKYFGMSASSGQHNDSDKEHQKKPMFSETEDKIRLCIEIHKTTEATAEQRAEIATALEQFRVATGIAA